ncbi:MAG: hypothetical protein JST80_05290 [Bdellovibrionales bacterium]|nr:hypothetical protein [Bdellovibrionales bacterium]
MRFAKIAIFLTGMIGLAMGGLMTISSFKQQQEEARIQTFEHLKSQAQVLVDQLYGAIEAAKTGGQGESTLPYVTHLGVLKLSQQRPNEFEFLNRSGTGKDAGADIPDLALEERVLKAIKQDFGYADLQITKFGIGTYEVSDRSNEEAIYTITPGYKTVNGQVDPTLIDKLNVTLIDPTKALASLNKLGGDNRAAFLINRRGKVLAHSSSSFVGSELKKFDALKDPIENLFLGAQTGIVTQYNAVDGRKEQVAFVRAGVYPFAIAAEQTAPPAVLSSAWWGNQVDSGAARKNAGVMMVLAAIAIALFAGTSVLVTRAQAKEADERRPYRRNDMDIDAPAGAMAGANAGSVAAGGYNPAFKRWTTELKSRRAESASFERAVPANAAPITNLEPTEAELAAVRAENESKQLYKNIAQESAAAAKSTNLNNSNGNTRTSENATPPDFNPPASIGSRAAEAAKAADRFVENRIQLNAENADRQKQAKQIVVAKDYEREFTERIRNNYTLETIERELASVSSELTESPVLYFRYHRGTQNLNLASVAGEVQIPNYALMQAYVRKDIEQQVERLASEGRVASISNYGPMSKLMISNLNTAHFEAWVVNSDAETSGTAKMVGVLVILQAGFRSAQTRPVLANILKEAGSTLYAQTSKLRPRRYNQTGYNESSSGTQSNSNNLNF